MQILRLKVVQGKMFIKGWRQILFDADNFYEYSPVKTVTLQHELPDIQYTESKSGTFLCETWCFWCTCT